MRVVDRSRHQHLGLVRGITEHQALVTSALIFRPRAVHALGDVDRLLADHVDHRAGVSVEADSRRVVTGIDDDLADQLFEIDPGRCGDFAADDDRTGLDESLASHTGVLVLSQDRVQDGIGNLVGHLVRMAFTDRLRGKQGFVHALLIS